MYIILQSESLKGRGRSGNLDTDGKIILNEYYEKCVNWIHMMNSNQAICGQVATCVAMLNRDNCLAV
jgi:hypothetical protein